MIKYFFLIKKLISIPPNFNHHSSYLNFNSHFNLPSHTSKLHYGLNVKKILSQKVQLFQWLTQQSTVLFTSTAENSTVVPFLLQTRLGKAKAQKIYMLFKLANLVNMEERQWTARTQYKTIIILMINHVYLLSSLSLWTLYRESTVQLLINT